MKKIAYAAFAAAAVLALAGCGSSNKVSGGSTADNVEMPAEEAMNAVDATATPAPDATTADEAGVATAGASEGAAHAAAH